MSQSSSSTEHAKIKGRYVGKWWAVAACAAMQIAAGLNITFGLYAPAVREEFHLNQVRLQGIGSASLSPGILAVIPGIIFDRLSHHRRFGPQFVAVVGGVILSVGYLLTWLSLKRLINSSYWVIVMEHIFSCHGTAWLDTASIAVGALNFPMQQGGIAGLLKSFHGMGGSLPADIYDAFSVLQGVNFTLFTAILAAAFTIVTVPFLNIVPWREQLESSEAPKFVRVYWRLIISCCLITVLILYQLISNLITREVPPDTPTKYGLLAGTVALTASILGYLSLSSCSFWSHPLHAKGTHEEQQEAPPHVYPSDEEEEPLPASEGAQPPSEPLLTDRSHEDYELARKVGRNAPRDTVDLEANSLSQQQAGETAEAGKTMRQALASPDFWIIWWAMFVGSGAGYVYLVNLGQQVPALGGVPGDQGPYVLAVSACNAFGRILIGFGSDFLLIKFKTPRTMVLFCLAVVNVFVLILAAFGNLSSLIVCSIAAGLILGGHWALMPAMITDLFGKKAFASILALLTLSTSVGGVVMNSGIVGPLYEFATNKQKHEGLCEGGTCFRYGYCILAGMSALEVVILAWLYMRNRDTYVRIHMQVRAEWQYQRK